MEGKVSCDASPRVASVISLGGSGATMAFQSCPKLGLHNHSLGVESPSRSMTLGWASLCS